MTDLRIFGRLSLLIKNIWPALLEMKKADEAKGTLPNFFISKTFPVIYRVAPPVITDYRNLFEKLFIEAFGNAEEDSRETINRLCRMVRPDANVRGYYYVYKCNCSVKARAGK